MIKEIRLSWSNINSVPWDYPVLRLLADKGFPVDDSLLYELKPKAGLIYYEFHDHKTDEIVVQWEE